MTEQSFIQRNAARAEMPTYYTVLDIATGEPRYKGTSLHGAAAALNPGTVCGSNTAQAGATLEAKRQRNLALTPAAESLR